MAQLSKLIETRSYIREWLAQGSFGLKQVTRAAQEQRANYESCKGRNPHWCSLEEYKQCVELLEQAAKDNTR